MFVCDYAPKTIFTCEWMTNKKIKPIHSVSKLECYYSMHCISHGKSEFHTYVGISLSVGALWISVALFMFGDSSVSYVLHI